MKARQPKQFKTKIITKVIFQNQDIPINCLLIGENCGLKNLFLESLFTDILRFLLFPSLGFEELT